jgi:hypothetical protein
MEGQPPNYGEVLTSVLVPQVHFIVLGLSC